MSEVKTFIIDCPWCKAKVAAIEHGRATKTGFHHEIGEPFSKTLIVGECPSCSSLLAGESHQVEFADFDGYEDRWSDVVRIYPKPTRSFVSYRIPRVVKDSIAEADKSLQANASIAACVMLMNIRPILVTMKSLEAKGQVLIISNVKMPVACSNGLTIKLKLSLHLLEVQV